LAGGDLVSYHLPGPAPAAGDVAGTRYYEIPLAIQDRSFNEDGSLFYPDSREYFDGYAGPYAPDTEVPPRWNPEFFGDAIVVNGRTWPVLADYFTGPPVVPPLEERGWKDTVIANPGEVTRIVATFDMAGLYLWHCHILEHEDNEMMRPYRVMPAP